MQRIRGKSSTSPKARSGEKELYKVANTVTLGKAEARWREWIWLGTIDTLDEHVTGTISSVSTCFCIAGVRDNFDAKAIGEMRGVPWQGSVKHAGTELRTAINQYHGAGAGGDFENHRHPNQTLKLTLSEKSKPEMPYALN